MSKRGARAKRVIILASGLAGAALLIALAFVEAISTGEERSPPGMPAPWADHLVALAQAQAAQDQRMAGLAYQEAYSSAFASQQWEAMADVADAALHLGDARRARVAYLTAAYRARRAHSAVGVLRVVEGFSSLGDQDVAVQWLGVARKLAGTDSMERERVGVATRRLAEHTGDAHFTTQEETP